jgi:hypothetical protein
MAGAVNPRDPVRLAPPGHYARMGLFRDDTPHLATVLRRPLRCLVCDGPEFTGREVKINTSGMEFFDLGWANRSALGVVCVSCGFVHEFLGDSVEFWDGGYPETD